MTARVILAMLLSACSGGASVTLGEATAQVCDATCLRQFECSETTSIQACSIECQEALCAGFDCDAPLEGDPAGVLECAVGLRAADCTAPERPEGCSQLF